MRALRARVQIHLLGYARSARVVFNKIKDKTSDCLFTDARAQQFIYYADINRDVNTFEDGKLE